jgi:large subunit ribosomal protein L25
VPAVLYGHGNAPRHLSLPGHELMLALKHDPNVLLTLVTEDGDQLARGQRDVKYVGAVAVEDGGHLAGPAGTAGAALAELVARLGGDADLGHDCS